MQPDPKDADPGAPPYVLDDQVGFVLRQVSQRHTALFATCFGGELTTAQWAVIARLHQLGTSSQNELGRAVAMDVATIRGIVVRLREKGLLDLTADPEDRRRVTLTLSPAGEALYQASVPAAHAATERTLAPLSERDRRTLMRLLSLLSGD